LILQESDPGQRVNSLILQEKKKQKKFNKNKK